jgi:gamma-glutamylcyclotransferase (GGCT)/AIG2-like uncharacterized protein YtfP
VINRLFVYGTLMPGEARWPLLSPLVSPADPEPAAAGGRLYRTPYGWPAAVFSGDAGSGPDVLLAEGAGATVPGLVLTLREPGRALPVLDEIEGTATGLFERRLIVTTAGRCWAYHWPGPTAGFRPIAAWTAGLTPETGQLVNPGAPDSRSGLATAQKL